MPDYGCYRMTGKKRIYFYLLAGLIFFFIGWLFYENIAASLLLCGLSYPAERYYNTYLAANRRKELVYQFRDLLYSLSASFATGRHMQEALEEACEGLKLIYEEGALIITELSHIVKRIRECRESEEELLWDFAVRSHLQDIRSFIDVYSICRKTGGNLEKAVMKAIDVLLDKIDMEREIHMLTAQKRAEAYILTSIPFIVMLFFRLLSPGYLDVLYETISGRIIMTLALTGIIISYLWSMKLTQIEI